MAEYWEYRVAVVEHGDVEALNDDALDGWELVSVSGPRAYLRRALSDAALGERRRERDERRSAAAAAAAEHRAEVNRRAAERRDPRLAPGEDPLLRDVDH